MTPIPVFWTQYTSTMQGRSLKAVNCENCLTEYLYVIEREALGVGTSMYMLNEQGAERHALTAAEDTLKSYLDNDFDPVPCPVCGHYQRYMFPKLLETNSVWVLVVTLVVIVVGCLAAVGTLKGSISYIQGPSDERRMEMLTAWSVFLLATLFWLGLSVLKKRRIRRFDPNTADPHVRIAIGRGRAITRIEFEKVQQDQKRD